MRIALVAWETLHSVAVGGAAVHVTELAAALERKGHEVHVFTRPGFGGSSVRRIDGVWYHYCGFDFHRNFIDEVQNMCHSFVWHILRCEDYMGAHFDVVHCHDWLAANAGVWAREGRGRKFILTMHSTEYGRNGNQFYGGDARRKMDHERHGTYMAHRVIAVSQALKNELCWMYNVPDWKCRAIYNGVNYHAFDGFIDCGLSKGHVGVAPMDPMILYSGRLTSQKGPDILLGAIPMLLTYYPHAKFVFMGDGDMRWPLIQRAQHMGIAHACRFLGHRTGAGLVDLFKACDIVCVPSRNEPFGIVILEAWAAGKPVVVTMNGGPNEFVWHGVNGLKVHAHPESIAWGLGTLAMNYDHARWMGRNGRIAVESAFSWDHIADQTLEIYNS